MRIGFYSTVPRAAWGGSEELWYGVAHAVVARGHQAYINCNRRTAVTEHMKRLAAAGAEVAARRRPIAGKRYREQLRRAGIELDHALRWIRRVRPDLLLISISHHLDDIREMAAVCRRLRVPYALLLQTAGPYHWVDESVYRGFRDAYAGARRCYFVSDQNRQTVEMNLVLDLSTAEVVDNAFGVAPDAVPPWPADGGRWRMAHVGRFDFISKGQDLVLQILSLPKWRERPLEVVFWGADNGWATRMSEYIRMRGLERQAKMGGFAHDIVDVWSKHHALLLPSRYEGNALAMIEAMLCGRVPIVTNVGRAAELVDDNRTGFVAQAATVELVDDAMERAWRKRDQWQDMGRQAALAVRQRHSLRPAEKLADRLLGLVEPPNASSRKAA